MRTAPHTREQIIAQAAPIFNQQGYSRTSISDIMRATGLKKGGIYNHFASKDELALAAFDYTYERLSQRVGDAMQQAGDDPLAQIQAMIRVYNQLTPHMPVAGGCPILNTAVDSDDTHPDLYARVQQVVNRWRRSIVKRVARGIERGVIRPDVDAEELASLIIATIEGAVLLVRLHHDPVHMQRATAHLLDHIERTVRQP